MQGRPLLGRYSGPKPEPRTPYQPSPFAPATRSTAAAIVRQDQRLQARTESAAGRRFTAAEQAAHDRRMQHPDNRWPVLQAQREAAQARTREPAALSLSNVVPDTEPLNGSLGGITLA